MLQHLKDQLQAKGTVTFTVHVHPGRPVTMAQGMLADGTVKIALHAVPEDGKANAELMRFLADEFGVSMQKIDILSGTASRHKLVKITA